MKGLGKHYSAYFEDEAGALWCAAGGCTTLEGAYRMALANLTRRQSDEFVEYRPVRLRLYECTQIEEYLPPEPTTSWRRVEESISDG